MTDDPITAALQQLADHHDQLTQLTELITGIGDTLREHQAALEKLAETPRRRRPGRLPPQPAAGVVEARGRRPGRTHRPPPGLGRAGLPPRLRPPGRHPRPLLELARPVPVRPGHPLRPVVRPLPPARTHPADPVGPSRIPGPHPARPGRPADHRNHPLRPHPAPPAQDVMTDATLRQALAYARRGWPVFPCLPGQKIPATTHGYKDATTDEQQITEWFGHGQRWNLAIATGTPGPDVLDIDQHGQAGNGYPAFARLAPRRTGQRRRRLRTDPGRRNARLLRWLGPAQRPPAQPPPRLPLPPAVTSWPRPPRSAASPTG